MKQIIHNIRNKPHHQKDRIIWITAAVAIGVLLLVWAIVGNGRRTTPDQNVIQTFNQDLQSGKNIVPANLNINTP